MSFRDLGLMDLLRFMLIFLLAVAALAGIVYLVILLVRKARKSAADTEYLKFNRELDAKLEKRGFKRTLVLNDNFAVDEEGGRFFCCFPYGRAVVETVLPLSAITEYKVEQAAAFTSGYIFTFAFVEQDPPRKVSRQAHIVDEDIRDRLLAALKKYGAVEAKA